MFRSINGDFYVTTLDSHGLGSEVVELFSFSFEEWDIPR